MTGRSGTPRPTMQPLLHRRDKPVHEEYEYRYREQGHWPEQPQCTDRTDLHRDSDGGNVVGTENLLIDGAGNPTNASDRMLCPFAAATGDIIPAYCNIVQAGSTYDLTVGSVTTSANDRFIGTDATNPVVLNYAVNIKPYGTTAGQIPAMGIDDGLHKGTYPGSPHANSIPGNRSISDDV